MDNTILPSQSPLEPKKKSLKLRPLEQLKKIIETNQVNPKTTKMEVFEIQGPTTENHIDDIIYPLIEAGITKAKVYATKMSDEAIHQVVVLTPIVTETFWGKLKAYLKWFKADEMAGVSPQKYTTNEDDDYTIIQTMEQPGVRKIGIPDDYEVISTSMFESSYILFNSKKLNSINRLQNMGENNPSSPISIDFCESLICTNDGKYKNSFKFSDDGSVVYAPEVTSSSFRALNCLAAEFELVGNQVVIRELVAVPEEYLDEIGNIQKQIEPQDAS